MGLLGPARPKSFLFLVLVLVFEILPCLAIASNSAELPDDFPIDPLKGNGGFQGIGDSEPG